MDSFETLPVDNSILTLIAARQQSHEISPSFANLLKAINTTTLGPSGPENLRKVEAVLDLHGAPIFQNSDRIAYVGSGEDWQFPVGLGAGSIDMVDPLFSDPSKVKSVFGSVREFDAEARMELQGEDNIISASIDLGKRPQPIQLKLIGKAATAYMPEYPLNGVLEFLGPTKIDEGEISPVLPNIAEKLQADARVLNFDFDQRQLPEKSGWVIQNIAKQSVLRVTDTSLIVALAKEFKIARDKFFANMPSSLGRK